MSTNDVDVLDEVVQQVELAHRTASGRVSPRSSRLGGRRLDLGEPAVDTDGACAGQAELDAVVRGRVV